jgi:hypothetical protein
MGICLQILVTLPSVKFQENPYGGSRVIGGDRRVDMKLIVAIRLARLKLKVAYVCS